MSQSMIQGKMTRSIVLLVLAVAVSALFFGMIRDFLLAVIMGAILAGLLHPLYLKLLARFGGRSWLAVTATILITLAVIVIPSIVFIGILVDQAIDLGQGATAWVRQQLDNPGELQRWLEETPLTSG